MANLQTLFQEVDGLSAAELRQLYEYIVDHRVKFLEAQDSAPAPQERIPGLHAHLGKARTSDDFDDELPDEFWGQN